MANKTVVEDVSALSRDDLTEEYGKLSKAYTQLKSLAEQKFQENYELKRSLQTATAAEQYLSQELDSIVSVHKDELENLKKIYAAELDDVRAKNSELLSTITSFEEMNTKLQEDLRLLEEQMKLTDEPEDVSLSKSSKSFDLQYEKNNQELEDTIETLKEQILELELKCAVFQTDQDNLKEEVECLRDNLQSKKDELNDKEQQLEFAQERMMDLSAELAALKSEPENKNAKGNSLFAEVDDQRQKMKQLLSVQKIHYLDMKRLHREREAEIRRLKRENAATHYELQKCIRLFNDADRSYQDRLNQRIIDLTKQNCILESKLSLTESRLLEMATNNGNQWLDAMMTFCKNETKELKDQLHSCRIEKSLVENDLHNKQQLVAKWRFDALKARFIIGNRELLLEDHNIPFCDVDFNEKSMHIKPEDFEKAVPNLDMAALSVPQSKEEPIAEVEIMPGEISTFDYDQPFIKEDHLSLASPNNETIFLNESILGNTICEPPPPTYIEEKENNHPVELCYDKPTPASSVKFLSEFRQIKIASILSQDKPQHANDENATVPKKTVQFSKPEPLKEVNREEPVGLVSLKENPAPVRKTSRVVMKRIVIKSKKAKNTANECNNVK